MTTMTTLTFDDTVRARHSVRAFLPAPVPRADIDAALAVAQHAPSNCNVQPWRVYLASGEPREKLSHALCDAFQKSTSPDMEIPIDTFPDSYREKQVACAVEMYRHMGVERGDMEGRMRAHRRNFEFFDAPHIAYICMEKHFGIGVALDVGVYVQTLMLAFTARGVACCPQAALRSYPNVARHVLSIRDSQAILCGLAFGYEDTHAAVNKTHQPRDPVANNVVFLD